MRNAGKDIRLQLRRLHLQDSSDNDDAKNYEGRDDACDVERHNLGSRHYYTKNDCRHDDKDDHLDHNTPDLPAHVL